MSKYGKEFQEIGHCGGQFTANVKTSEDGHRAIQFGIRGSSPNPAAYFAIYVLPQGIPVGTIQLGGIGEPWNPAPVPDCFPIFVGSDSHGLFGHQCHRCNGYWRSKGAPSKWAMTCPYCGLRAETYRFLTDGQVRYIESCCEMIENALSEQQDGEHVIDMDSVADAVLSNRERPKFYYTEESQQNKYECRACGDTNDILGRYGYCSCCGTHNGLQEFEADVESIRYRIEAAQEYEACTKDVVSAFDSFARQIAKQLAKRVPMTKRRQNEWERKKFHNLAPCTEALKSVFDIDLFRSCSPKDIAFATLMFHRRHVYEHNGGEVDEKYIRDSGDTSVRPKQVIRENSETAIRTTDIVSNLGKNLHDGFHNIFPPQEIPIRMQHELTERRKKSQTC